MGCQIVTVTQGLAPNGATKMLVSDTSPCLRAGSAGGVLNKVGV